MRVNIVSEEYTLTRSSPAVCEPWAWMHRTEPVWSVDMAAHCIHGSGQWSDVAQSFGVFAFFSYGSMSAECRSQLNKSG
jgi:hypothetical protein